MKGRTVLVLLVIAAAIVWFLWRGEPPSPPAPVADRSQPTAPAVAAPEKSIAPPAPPPSTPVIVAPAPQPAPAADPTAAPPSAALPTLAEAPTAPPQNPGAVEADLDNVQFAIRDYRNALKENPVGSNAEITKALLGDNLKQVKVPMPVGSSMNGEGELCDRWGTPYFFHQLSKTSMEIRSAGPDRKMWTNDDRQVK